MNKNICPVCGRVGVCWINYSTAEEYYRCSKCPNRWYPEKKVKRTGIMRLQEKMKGLEERLLVSKGFIQMIADCGGFGSAAAKDVLLKIEGVRK